MFSLIVILYYVGSLLWFIHYVLDRQYYWYCKYDKNPKLKLNVLLHTIVTGILTSMVWPVFYADLFD